MPLTQQQLQSRLSELIAPETRGRLFAKGLARGMIWKGGKLPEEAPSFSESLTEDLVDHGFAVLRLSMQLRRHESDSALVERGFRTAAECLESAVRRGAISADRTFYLLVAACAFHLAHMAASAYSLLSGLQVSELEADGKALYLLIRRDISELSSHCLEWLGAPANRDEALASRLEAAEVTGDDVLVCAVTKLTVGAMVRLCALLQLGDATLIEKMYEKFTEARTVAQDHGLVVQWWTAHLAKELTEDLWARTFRTLLPTALEVDSPPWPDLRERFIAALFWRSKSQVDLWPSQIEAARRIANTSDSLVVALPTSAGKTRIAELAILRTLSAGRRVIYVTPLRALSAQVERVLAEMFGPLGFRVSAMYGASGVSALDVEVLSEPDIVVATPEKLDFSMRQVPDAIDDVGLVVLDEGHMIGLGDREIRYEVLVQRLLKRHDASSRRIVCLSAIFQSGTAFDDFVSWLRNDVVGKPVVSDWRPTRRRTGVVKWKAGRNDRPSSGELTVQVDREAPFLRHFIEEKPATPPRRNSFPHDNPELVLAVADRLLGDGHSVLIFCPLRASVGSVAKNVVKTLRQGFLPNLTVGDEVRLRRLFGLFDEWLGPQSPFTLAAKVGVGIHHGALPRPVQAEVERLLNEKALRLVVASPSLAQGVDLSCSALVLYSLHRNKGTIPVAELANVMGRAGRAYVDLDGLVLYPIFEQGAAASSRERTWDQLLRQVGTQDLQSGILELVVVLISTLAQTHGQDAATVLEYLSNARLPMWELPEVAPATRTRVEDYEGDKVDFQDALHLLDLTVLSVDERDEVPLDADTVGAALDQFFAGSFFQRQLLRRSATQQQEVKWVLAERANWLWSRTSRSERKGFYQSGVGYRAGRFLVDNLDMLNQLLSTAEVALIAGDHGALVEFAGLIFQFEPFRPAKPLPDGWSAVLAAWLNGECVYTGQGETSEKQYEFISDALVFRLVWAIEAVRQQVAVGGVIDSWPVTDALQLALTFGVPDRRAAALLRLGLPSRVLAMRWASLLSDDLTDAAEIARYLRSVEWDWTTGLEASHHEAAMIDDLLQTLRERARTEGRFVSKNLSIEWRMYVPALHHIAVTTDGEVIDLDGNNVGRILAPTTLPKTTFGTAFDDRVAVSYFA